MNKKFIKFKVELLWGTSQAQRAKRCQCKHKKKKKPTHTHHKVQQVDNTPAIVEQNHQQIRELEELFNIHPGDESMAFFSIPAGCLPKEKLPKK